MDGGDIVLIDETEDAARILGYFRVVPDADDPCSGTLSTWFVSPEVARDPVALERAADVERYMSNLLTGIRRFDLIRRERLGDVNDHRAGGRDFDEKLAITKAWMAGARRVEGR